MAKRFPDDVPENWSPERRFYAASMEYCRQMLRDNRNNPDPNVGRDLALARGRMYSAYKALERK